MIPLTPEQAAAAHARQASVAVAAGAGTGKTRVITARYVHLVQVRGVPPARILAVTFTEKAARQMKDRIRTALGAAGREDLARAAEFAPISTIHAFLARTLRERALDAGIDPRFALADEMTAERMLEEALAATVDALPQERRELLAGLAGAEEALRSLYLAARATPHAMGDLRGVEPDTEGLGRRLGAFLDRCANESATAAGTKSKLAALGTLRTRLLAFDATAAEEFQAAVKGSVAPAQGELFREGKELAKEFAPLRHREQARAVAAATVEALADLDARYAQDKSALGLLDFADLERLGLKLLQGPAGPAIAAAYDHLLVDEFQDTSRIQEAILDLLAVGRELFAVGDAKQSIYRFRYADAAVFASIQDRSATFPLAGSFRTRPELLAFTNALFGRLFRGSNVAPQDLRAEAAWRPKEPACVEVLAPLASHAAEGRRREAILLARRLREIVERKELPITRAERAEGPLRYGDCALLVRATTHLGVYERALADAGVPYVVVKGRGYYAAREVVELAHLLLLLHDPGDDFRAVVVMTSLLCGATDGDLLRLPGEGPLPSRALAAPAPPLIAPERWSRLQEFARRFQRWRDLAGRLETGDLVETILLETRFGDLLLVEPDGRRRHANLAKALRRARASTLDPESFARELLEFRERELRESEAPIAGEADDVVKVMTVHAAKGLEFPLVAVADLTAGKRGGDGTILHPDGAFGFKIQAEPERIEPPGLDRLKAWEKAEEAAERHRLLYVALTRAEEHLILSGALTPRADRSLFDALPPDVVVQSPAEAKPLRLAARAAASVRGALRRAAALPVSVPRDGEGARALVARVDALAPPKRDATPYVTAAADLLEFARCPRRYRLGRMWGLQVESALEVEAEEGGGGEHARRTLGTVLHDLLARFGPGAEPGDEEIVERFPEATRADREQIRGWCSYLAGLDCIRQAAAGPHEREMLFLTRIAGLAVRGVMDLYAPGLPLLLDYKTSRRAEPGEYAVQMAVYLAALKSLDLPAPPTAQLVYVAAREVVEVGAQPLEPLVEAFRDAHRGDGSFPPAPGPLCRHCEFRPVCVANGVGCP
ncbi:MAG: UvrD-helicase domain-containing protein [Planctomycetaceae bacterium]